MSATHGRYLLLIDIEGGGVSADSLAIAVVLPAATFGVPYAGAYIGSGGTPAYTYATSTGSLPPGLSLNTSTGEITGTPTTPGYYEFTASVTDSVPDTASKVVAITVGTGIVVGGLLSAGEVGIAYSSGLSASGGTAPYTWTVSSGSLPGGLSIDATTGIISGTPSADGTFNFTLTATDAASVPQDFPTAITIVKAVDLSTSSFGNGVVNVAYSAGPTTLFGLAPFTYSISSGAIPLGTNFSPSNGFVTGTPTTAATYNFDVTVLDALGGTDTFSETVVISASGGGSAQAAIQFDDEGSPLGTAGTVDEVDFVGSGVTATRASNKVTVTIPGGSGVTSVGATAPIASSGGATPNITHNNSGVTAASYSNASITVDAKGHITAAANGSATLDVQVFTTSGTWTKPPNAKSTRVYLLGAAGGGSGGCRITGGSNTSPAPGGGGGACRDETYDASTLSSTVAVTIGAGGTGATASTTSSRNASTSGGSTTFGTLLTAFGGGGNVAGASSGSASGSGAGSLQAGAIPATPGTTALGGRVGGTSNASGNTTLNYDATSEWGGAAGGGGASAGVGQRGGDASGGGPGGGASGSCAGTVGQGGGDGGASTNVLGGTAGTGGGTTTNGTAGADGSNPTTLLGAGSGGGGGGSGRSSTSSGTTSGKGGKGGRGAGGGGGGSGELATTGGSAGGDGGPGYAVVITECSV